jgi:hypothetical protein
MSSLLDLGPLIEEVEIRGVKLTVRGLSFGDVFKLFSEIPNVQQLVADLGSPQSVMLNIAPEMFAKIIAMATGSPDDKAVEERAAALAAWEQVQIMSAVQRLSFREGFVPFVNQMTMLMGTSTITATPSGTTSAQGNSSHDSSSGELQTDSPGMTRGTSPRAN